MINFGGIRAKMKVRPGATRVRNYFWRSRVAAVIIVGGLPRLCKGKFIFVLACLLVWTSTHCAVLCASPAPDVASTQMPAGEPPCHHHHHSGDDGKSGSSPCNHTEVQTAVPQSFEKVAVVADLYAMDLPVALPVPQSQTPLTPSPTHDLLPLPDPGMRLSVVLRI
jgi:hypothetical protein